MLRVTGVADTHSYGWRPTCFGRACVQARAKRVVSQARDGCPPSGWRVLESDAPRQLIRRARRAPNSRARRKSRARPDDMSRSSRVLSVRFNQNGTFLSVATEDGFAVFQCAPFQQAFRRQCGGGLAQSEMLFQCQLLALLGGGPSPRYLPNKVVIWDDARRQETCEVSLRAPVKAVRMRNDAVAAACQHRVCVYRLQDMSLVLESETLDNPMGLVAMSSLRDACVLACLGLRRGQVRVEHVPLDLAPGQAGYAPQGRTRFIDAHQSDIRSLELSLDGSLLATSSVKGTLIRVFRTATGECLHELRRGAEQASIYSLAISPQNRWLAASSSTQTVHVFNLQHADAATGTSGQVAGLVGRTASNRGKQRVQQARRGALRGLGMFQIPGRRAQGCGRAAMRARRGRRGRPLRATLASRAAVAARRCPAWRIVCLARAARWWGCSGPCCRTTSGANGRPSTSRSRMRVLLRFASMGRCVTTTHPHCTWLRRRGPS